MGIHLCDILQRYQLAYKNLYFVLYTQENLDVVVYEAMSYDEVISDLESGYADAFYGPATYVEDFAGIGLLADIEQALEQA